MQEMDIEPTLFEIITEVGSARSLYIEAIQAAREKEIDKAKELIREGQGAFNKGHHIHADLIREVSGEDHVPVFQKDERIMLLTHAEDQLMSAEAFGILAEEFLALYQAMSDKGVL
ncbi:PTS lactose/cellobiose transporter subunit IIA [Caproiciproducens sp. R2]|uniref:PTS lactose/cellobiose transporter subunit IIA n=1 Tax=Caproiciproducens sp. R2 TaxID=3435187 RepID=UPI004033E47A